MIDVILGGDSMVDRLATVQYRYLKTEGLWDSINLKDMVVDVIRRTPVRGGQPLSALARLRKMDLDQDGSYVLLNKLSPVATWDGPVFGGQLIHVKSGAELPGITGSLEDDLAEFELQNLDLGSVNQIVDGVLYFVVAGNHVGIIEGRRTRGRTLERYLSRLLQQAGELEPGQVIILNAKLNGGVQNVEQMTITPQRGFAIGSDQSRVQTQTAAEEAGEGATVLDVLRLLGWDDDQITRLQESVPADGWIEGAFRVLFKKGRGRKTSVERQVLEEALRNLDTRSIGLLGDGKEKNGQVKLSERRLVAAQGDLLDPEAAMTSIASVLQSWAERGKIDCSFDQ